VIVPGYLAGAAPYYPLENLLKQAGVPAVTVPLTRWNWIPTIGGRSVTPILEQLEQTVRQVMAQFNVEQVNLVGHSAGGWLARIYLGDKPYDVHEMDQNRKVLWQAHRYVATLITLGTPHTSRERWTRRNLDFVNTTYPGAYHDDVNYVCVAGKAVYGQRNWRNWVAYNSYELTCGQGAVWGDGITPISAAHLEGAKNISLEQVIHSPRPGSQWYGSPEVVTQWMQYLA
jgi:triacylglycerol esterase/lipase EstA (alpha/beta hydrolase family)